MMAQLYRFISDCNAKIACSCLDHRFRRLNQPVTISIRFHHAKYSDIVTDSRH